MVKTPWEFVNQAIQMTEDDFMETVFPVVRNLGTNRDRLEEDVKAIIRSLYQTLKDFGRIEIAETDVATARMTGETPEVMSALLNRLPIHEDDIFICFCVTAGLYQFHEIPEAYKEFMEHHPRVREGVVKRYLEESRPKHPGGPLPLEERQRLGIYDNSLQAAVEALCNARLVELWAFMGELDQPVGQRAQDVADMQRVIEDAFTGPPEPEIANLRKCLQCVTMPIEDLFWEYLGRAGCALQALDIEQSKQDRLGDAMDRIVALSDAAFPWILEDIQKRRGAIKAAAGQQAATEVTTLEIDNAAQLEPAVARKGA